ncbi:beige/beach-related [Anaeramoeba ignava]|uniref:Beige/beach-related n=1 Tax=Anaeramoeba ignava TaxID=1746090 RepID=A0A9Q0R434_ANAIG|nr:beige/beach-related [Anaeramoeba ignava]
MPEIFGSQGFADKFQTFFTQAIPQDVPFLTRHQDEILQVFSSLFKTLSECITKEQPTKTVNNPHQVGSRNKKVTLFKQEMAKKMRLQVDPIESILLSILKTLIQQFYHFFQLIFRDSSGKQILPLKPKDSPFKVSGAHYLRDVFSQPSWDFTIEHIIFPSNGRVEQFWKNQVKFLESRLDSTLPVIKSKMNQEALDGRSSFGARYKELLTQFKNLIAQESLGISRLSEEFQKKLRFAFRKLRWMLRESMNERGVWGNPLTKEEQNSMRWKLDKTEDSCRRRRKLKPNFHFDNHLDASLDPKINPKFAQTMNQATDLNLSKDAKEKLSRVSLGMSQDPDDFLLAERSKQNENDLFEKKIIIESRQCELISPLKKISGILEITNISLDFFVKQNSEFNETTSNLNIQQKMSIGNDYSWKLKDILFVYKRRYQLRQSGIEIFLKDRTNFFLNFDKKDRDKIYSKILNLVPNKQNFDISTGSAEEWFKKSDISLLWQKRLITNFDYLMLLNTIAGRTYNDISQYPIFPWVISDYESTNIDLSNPSVYRDLSKPIGALNPERFLYFKKRYETFVDPDQIVPPFYYGSHYSNAGIVVSYLVRCEPFTTLFIKLNDGKFDRADRMFHSLPETWRNCMTSTSDVKELIPEFFYFPEFLENQNNFALGKRQDKQELNDCILPKWAKSAEEFVHINRLALESEYISSNLHKWIDLIFGYKQQGEEAIRAGNLFYYLTYEKTVNIDAINDESERLAIETQIESFGQTPTQLLRRPHPRRNTREEANLPPIYFAEKNFPLLKLYFITIAKNSLIHVKFIQHSRYLSYLGIPDSVLILDRARVLGLYRWTPNDLKVQSNPFSFELDHSLSENQKSMGVTFAYDLTRFANCFEYSQSAQRLFSCGYWDDSFKLSTIESARVTQSVVRHKDVVTCLALGFNSTDHILATGSKDTTVIIWSFDMKSRSVSQTPKHVLYGHDDVVTCLAISLDLDLVISGSKDGSCIVHTVRRGRYVRSVYVSDSPVEIYLVKISPDGLFMIYSSDLLIRIFSLNGKFLKSASVSSPVLDWQLTSDASYLVTGCLDGSLLIWNFFDLVVVSNINLKSSIFSLSFSNNEQFLIAGLSDGRLAILAIELGKEK